MLPYIALILGVIVFALDLYAFISFFVHENLFSAVKITVLGIIDLLVSSAFIVCTALSFIFKWVI